MERTELREAFFAETRRDPYAHMIAHMAARSWAHGYEQALRDVAVLAEAVGGSAAAVAADDLRHAKTFSERMDDAIKALTDGRDEHAKTLIALAQTGLDLDRLRSTFGDQGE